MEMDHQQNSELIEDNEARAGGAPLDSIHFHHLPNCPQCQYDLEGLLDGRPCPECGLPLETNVLFFEPNKSKARNVANWINYVAAVVFSLFYGFFGWKAWSLMSSMGAMNSQLLKVVSSALVVPAFFVLIAVLSWYASRQPRFAIIGPKTILWQSWLRGRRVKSWADVADIRFRPNSGQIVLIGVNQRPLSDITPIIGEGQKSESLLAAFHTMRYWWLTAIAQRLVEVSSSDDKDSECGFVAGDRHSFKESIVFDERSSTIAPLSWQGLIGAAGMGFVGYNLFVGLEFKQIDAILAGVGGCCFTIIVLAIDCYRRKGLRQLKIDDLGIRWVQLDGKLLDIAWPQVDAVLIVPGTNVICLRHRNRELIPIPVEFIPSRTHSADAHSNFVKCLGRWNNNEAESDNSP